MNSCLARHQLHLYVPGFRGMCFVQFQLRRAQYCLTGVFLGQDNQKDLENATEQLSEYLERDITSDILVDIKQKVQDKYR